MDDVLKNAAATFSGYSSSLNSFDIASITENQLNSFIQSQGALGHKYLLHREIADSNNKVNYIAVDNAYMNITNNAAIISVGLNLNGLETYITVKMDLDATESTNKLVFKPNKIYFGKEEKGLAISQDTSKVIYETLAQAMNQSSVKFEEDGTMTISFDGLINQVVDSIDTSNPVSAQYKNFLQNSADLKVVVEGSEITDNSVVKIQAIRH